MHTVNIFVTFSDLPFKLSTAIGLFACLGGIGWLAVIVALRISGVTTVSGYASVMAGELVFGGVQLFVLGIFGEYLGRINFKSSKMPLFLVGQTTGSQLQKE